MYEKAYIQQTIDVYKVHFRVESMIQNGSDINNLQM